MSNPCCLICFLFCFFHSFNLFILSANFLCSGYMSPEYAMNGAFSVKSDTYSFGVILLEIISGLKISLTHITDFPNLLAYVSTVACLKFLQFNKKTINVP